MNPNPIHKVLSSIQNSHARALLMGGQACIFYGGAEFSRDTDLAVLADDANLRCLQEAFNDLEAECIAVPPFDSAHLERGHAIHFRCGHPECRGMRVDIMSKMRGVDPFNLLWARRATATGADGRVWELLALPDLVQAKKTQRDKDWPMIRRLLEADYFKHQDRDCSEKIPFWLRELRTPRLLTQTALDHPEECRRLTDQRPLLSFAIQGDLESLGRALLEEEQSEREKDRRYWLPLKKELEVMRHQRPNLL